MSLGCGWRIWIYERHLTFMYQLCLQHSTDKGFLKNRSAINLAFGSQSNSVERSDAFSINRGVKQGDVFSLAFIVDTVFVHRTAISLQGSLVENCDTAVQLGAAPTSSMTRKMAQLRSNMSHVRCRRQALLIAVSSLKNQQRCTDAE